MKNKFITICLGIGLGLLILASSCARKINWALECAMRYPVKTQYVAGKPRVFHDTLTVKGDSIPCPEVTRNGKPFIPKVKCPDSKLIRDSVVLHDTLRMENTAKADLYRQELTKAQVQTDQEIKAKAEAQKKCARRTHQLIWCFILLCISICYQNRKLLFALIKPV